MSTPAIRVVLATLLGSVAALGLATATAPAQGPPRLLGWNDLGMHCMDADTSVFSILPPFNTFHAQLIVGGRLVTNTSYSVTYEATADPRGSINSTSIGKTDFWLHAQALFGASLQLDEGLFGFRMPGAANTPQAMPFHPALANFMAEGVPVTPYDDSGAMNPYPLMRLVARNAQGQVVASTDAVVPVSAEMACLSCHASGGNPAARPASGWVHGPAATDDRWNILKLHDDRQAGDPVYASALQAVGYSASGLYATAVQGTPVLCARCHSSNALSAPGQPGVSAMTSAMHLGHANARLVDGRRLDDVHDRSSCYTCHPGAATRCLRGAMGKAIGADGEAMMSCQDCHGSMAAVGDPARIGWLQEPNCQSCHTGDAVQNMGAIRFANAFDTPGHLRTPTNQRFATTPDVPQPGVSLYRFSTGHGGLECSACHGSPHAIWPATEDNDNVQSIAAQGHKGLIVECSSCHSGLQDNQLIGPHGMHPTDGNWLGKHQDFAQNLGIAACRVCHGTTLRGTVLSRVQGDRTISTRFGARTFWRGYEVGCYECHNGPSSDHAIVNAPPVVQSRVAATPTDQPLVLTLSATDADADPLTLRIVEQPRHGAVAFDGTHATYRAWDDYTGADSFTYAATDTKRNSNLGTVDITVQPRACAGTGEVFGHGCADGAGQVPTIGLEGCPTAGGQIAIAIGNLPSPTFVVFGFGLGRGAIELAADGCALRIANVFVLMDPLFVQGGQFTLPVLLPLWFGPWDATTQAAGLDATAARGFVATPGLEVHVR